MEVLVKAKKKKMSTGQMRQLLEIDAKEGLFAEIQALIARKTKGGVKLAGPQEFFQELYDELFPGKGIVVPPLMEVSAETAAALEKYPQLMWWYFPSVTEADYPNSFVKPKWGQYTDESEIERKPIEGFWGIVDTTPKLNWDDEAAYKDQITEILGLKTRFGVSWNDCVETHYPKLDREFHLTAGAFRHMTAEQYNLFANVMNELRASRGMDLPDLGSTYSWEWCDNRYDSGFRLLVGNREFGGLALVDSYRPSRSNDCFAFRFVAVL
ncbi:MAG: hypothetical protein WCJ29_00385 [bacterium]